MKRKDIQFVLICIGVAALILIAYYVVWPPTHRLEGTLIGQADVAEYQYVASVLREPFHNSACTWAKKISPENLIGFKTRQDALDSGRRPCKVCKP